MTMIAGALQHVLEKITSACMDVKSVGAEAPTPRLSGVRSNRPKLELA